MLKGGLITSVLNQVYTWFLEITFVRDVSMRVCLCVSAPETINN